jgi:hypothetical protein
LDVSRSLSILAVGAVLLFAVSALRWLLHHAFEASDALPHSVGEDSARLPRFDAEPSAGESARRPARLLARPYVALVLVIASLALLIAPLTVICRPEGLVGDEPGLLALVVRVGSSLAPLALPCLALMVGLRGLPKPRSAAGADAEAER